MKASSRAAIQHQIKSISSVNPANSFSNLAIQRPKSSTNSIYDGRSRIIQSRTTHNHKQNHDADSNHQTSNQVSTSPSAPTPCSSDIPSDAYASPISLIDGPNAQESNSAQAWQVSDQYELHRDILSGQQIQPGAAGSALLSLVQNVPKDFFNSTAHSIWQSSSDSKIDSVEIDSDPTPEFDPIAANLNFLESQHDFPEDSDSPSLFSSRISSRNSGSAAHTRPRARRSFVTSSRNLTSGSLHIDSCPDPFRSFKTNNAISFRAAHTATSASRNQDQFPNLSHSSPSSSNSNLDLSFPSHLKNPSPYDIFHLPKKASQKQIKERYFDLVRNLHPDRVNILRQTQSSRSSSEDKDLKQVEEEFKVVISAYELLSNPSRRRTYDLSGYGWNDGVSTSSSHSTWNGKAPRNQDEWRAYQEWSDSLRRSSGRGSGFSSGYKYGFRGGHDGFGWQQYANNPQDQEAGSRFYGFQSASSSSAGGPSGSFGYSNPFTSNPPGKPQPIYTSNTKFFTSIFILTWTLGYFQYERLSVQSEKATKRADLNHLDAAINLDKAREEARSEEGRLRREAWRKRVRETGPSASLEGVNGRVGSVETPLALEAGDYGIGRGGPSGKAAAEERNRKAKLRMDIEDET